MTPGAGWEAASSSLGHGDEMVWCGVEEEEEEEERLPWSHVRWAVASSLGGPTQALPRESSVLPPLE